MSNERITLREASLEMTRLERTIRDMQNKLGHDCDNVAHNEENLDEDYMLNQYYGIMEKLQKISWRLEWLNKPVHETGYLRHNKDGRYAFPSGNYFTSGSTCELLYSPRDGVQYWIYTSIEHNGEDYYATTLGADVNINNMMARSRY